MKRYLRSYLFFFFLLSVMYGCGKDSTVEEPPAQAMYEYDDPVIPEGDSIILFRTLDVAEAQKAVQGEWEVYYQEGGVVGYVEPTDFYWVYIGDTTRVINGGKMMDTVIAEWRQTINGTELSFGEGNPHVEILRYIYHDTLHTIMASREIHYPIFMNFAARVKDK